MKSSTAVAAAAAAAAVAAAVVADGAGGVALVSGEGVAVAAAITGEPGVQTAVARSGKMDRCALAADWSSHICRTTSRHMSLIVAGAAITPRVEEGGHEFAGAFARLHYN